MQICYAHRAAFKCSRTQTLMTSAITLIEVVVLVVHCLMSVHATPATGRNRLRCASGDVAPLPYARFRLPFLATLCLSTELPRLRSAEDLRVQKQPVFAMTYENNGRPILPIPLTCTNKAMHLAPIARTTTRLKGDGDRIILLNHCRLPSSTGVLWLIIIKNFCLKNISFY